MTPDQSSLAIVLAEIERHGTPNTPEDLCPLGARVMILSRGVPPTDLDFIDAAYGLAFGLHSDAWAEACETAKWFWIDTCEAMLREVAKELSQ